MAAVESKPVMEPKPLMGRGGRGGPRGGPMGGRGGPMGGRGGPGGPMGGRGGGGDRGGGRFENGEDRGGRGGRKTFYLIIKENIKIVNTFLNIRYFLSRFLNLSYPLSIFH